MPTALRRRVRDRVVVGLRTVLPHLDALAQRRYVVTRWLARHAAPPADGGLLVSVIIPIYNCRPYLPDCLDSVLGQDIGAERIEIICVDDGSDDGSAEVVRERCRHAANLRLIELPHSGWPGAPRNAGLAQARGRYVFFLDADDLLRTDALRRLVVAAERLGGDVVIPRVRGIGGRFTGHPYPRSRRRAPVTVAMRTLTVHKLIRRALVERHSIRFPEGVVPLEDGLFITRCYLTAARIVVRADDEYYFVRRRPDRSNISRRPPVADRYVGSVTGIAAILNELAPASQRAVLVTDLFRRKCLHLYPTRFLGFDERRRRAWVAAQQTMLDTQLPAPSWHRLSHWQGELVRLIRAGDVDAVAAHCRSAAHRR